MSNILTTYLAREILKTSAATVLVLFVILVSNALGRVLADIADGDIPQQALWPVMLSQSVNLMSLLLPIGFFFGIVFALGRMYKDHEMVVMFACGVGYRELYKPVLILLLPLLLFSIYASLWLNAQVQRDAEAKIESAENLNEFQQIKAGQFNQSGDGNHVIFMESISEDRRELRDIIISQTDRDTMVLETAQSGQQEINDDSGDLFLVVGPGQRYEGNAGERAYRLIRYDQHGILIENKRQASASRIDDEQLTPAQLWASTDIKQRVELHWRIAIPVVLLVLALLAVPLAHIAPRQGRFGKVGYALLVYVAYFNLIAVTRAQLEAETWPMAVNFWGVHALFVGITLALIYRRNRGLFTERNST